MKLPVPDIIGLRVTDPPHPTMVVDGIPVFVDSPFAREKKVTGCFYYENGTFAIHMTKDHYDGMSRNYIDYIIYHELGHVKFNHLKKIHKTVSINGVDIANHPEFEAEADAYAIEKIGLSFSEYKGILHSVLKKEFTNAVKVCAIEKLEAKSGLKVNPDGLLHDKISKALVAIAFHLVILFSSGYKKRIRLTKKMISQRDIVPWYCRA
jgi:hypothetical protein